MITEWWRPRDTAESSNKQAGSGAWVEIVLSSAGSKNELETRLRRSIQLLQYTHIIPVYNLHAHISLSTHFWGFSLIVKWCSCDLWPLGVLSCDHSRWKKLALKFFCQTAICQKVHSTSCKKTHRTCHCGLVGCTQGFHLDDWGLYPEVGATFLFSVKVWLGLAKKKLHG